eukprot:3221776-Pyramimonas_sp.AAC.1
MGRKPASRGGQAPHQGTPAGAEATERSVARQRAQRWRALQFGGRLPRTRGGRGAWGARHTANTAGSAA